MLSVELFSVARVLCYPNIRFTNKGKFMCFDFMYLVTPNHPLPPINEQMRKVTNFLLKASLGKV